MDCKRFKITIVILLLSFVLNAQKSVSPIMWGEEYKSGGYYINKEIVSYTNDELIVMYSRYKGAMVQEPTCFVEKFKANNLVDSKELEMPPTTDYKMPEKMIQVGSEYYLFYTATNLHTQTSSLFCQTVDIKTLQFSSDPKKMYVLDCKGARNAFRAKYLIMQSPDKKMCAIIRKRDEKDASPFQFEVEVFDENMKTIWSKSYSLPYSEELFDEVKVSLSNEGDVFMLGKEYVGKRREDVKNKVNYYFRLLCYTKNGEQTNDVKLFSDIGIVSEMTMALSDNNTVICAGFYSITSTFKSSGVGVFVYDFASNSVVVSKAHAYTEQMFSTEKKNKGELDKFFADTIEIEDDGSCVLIGENRLVKHTNIEGKSSTTYIDRDIIVTSFSADGALNWMSKVEKKQIGKNNGELGSYVYFKRNSEYCFLFNDKLANLGLQPGQKALNTAMKRTNDLMFVTISDKGVQNRELYASRVELNTALHPKLCKRVNENSVILFGGAMRKWNVGLLELK